MALVFSVVVAHELLFAFAQNLPVAVLHGSGVACALLLFLHLFLELFAVYGEPVFAADEFGEVQREAVCVEKSEGSLAVELCELVRLELVHGSVEQVDAAFERAQERVFLFLHHARDKLLLCFQFGESVAHLVDQCGKQSIEEGFLLAEEGVGVAHCAAQYAADNVSSLGVAGQLSVGNGESHCTQVVGADAHGHVGVLVMAVFHA